MEIDDLANTVMWYLKEYNGRRPAAHEELSKLSHHDLFRRLMLMSESERSNLYKAASNIKRAVLNEPGAVENKSLTRPLVEAPSDKKSPAQMYAEFPILEQMVNPRSGFDTSGCSKEVREEIEAMRKELGTPGCIKCKMARVVNRARRRIYHLLKLQVS